MGDASRRRAGSFRTEAATSGLGDSLATISSISDFFFPRADSRTSR